MKIARSADYPASPEQVIDILRRQDFQEAKCAATHALSSTAAIEESGGRLVVRTERRLPADGLPDFARSLVGDQLTVQETQDWGPAEADGSRRADLRITVPGAPVTMTGVIRLEAISTGSTETVDADFRAQVPLLGGRIEKAAGPLVADAVDKEIETVRTWLTR